MVRAGTGLVLLLLALAPAAALTAQEAPPAPPPAAGDSALDLGGDPVGMLLENKDTLRLEQPVVDELVRINLDLFRRTRRIQRSIDSIVPPQDGDAFGQRRQRQLSEEQRQRLEPLLAARRAETRRAQDAALALLTPSQLDQLRRLAERMAARGRRRPPAF